MNEMERRVLGMLLAGEDHLLRLLRDQMHAAVVVRRDFTGVGFSRYLAVPTDLPRAKSCTRLVLGDLYAEVEGLEHAAGFLLFVADGAVDSLECFTVEDRWPEAATSRRVDYVHPAAPGSGTWSAPCQLVFAPGFITSSDSHGGLHEEPR